MNKTITPPFIPKLLGRLRENPHLIQVLLGPRQIGKTTSILNLLESRSLPDGHYVSADKVFNSDHKWIAEQWSYAKQNRKVLIIDEIQKCTNWSETIKKLFDQSRRKKENSSVILLGSSSLEIQKGLTESLTGRFQLTQAYHWNFSESKEAYELTFEDYLKFGGYPGSYSLIKSQDWYDYVLNSIVNTVIEKDILQFQNVKNPALFKQAFEMLINYPAQEISYTKLLGQLQDRGNVEIIKYYLSLYQGAFLFKVLHKYSNKPIVSKASSPKIVPMAPCLFQLNVKDSYTSEEKGRAFEALVGAQLVRTGLPLFYWREGADEVDFVLKDGRNIYGIEVKSRAKKRNGGLDVFRAKFNHAVGLYIDMENYFEFEKDPLEFLRTSAI